jgi:hypothetical protein
MNGSWSEQSKLLLAFSVAPGCAILIFSCQRGWTPTCLAVSLALAFSPKKWSRFTSNAGGEQEQAARTRRRGGVYLRGQE